MRVISRSTVIGLFTASAIVSAAHATPVQVRVMVQNLAATNDISFAPLRVGFHSGVFDAFNVGQLSGPANISIAEGGSGSAWFPAFAAADPNATLGTVVGTPAGPLLPGVSASTTFTVDPAVNPFFTFASMVVPSNDHFIGNDSPTAFRLFNAQGDLNLASISQFGRDVWDNGSELTNPLNAAFLQVGNNDLREAENGVVTFNFDRLDAFNGLTTAAGYTFNRQFGANTEIYRISFQIVPAPSAAAAFGACGLLAVRRRRTR